MLITAMTKAGRTKTRITIDEDLSMVLSDRVISIYDFHENKEIPEEILENLLAQLRQDAVRKCGDLLSRSDYSEKGLRDKLLQAGYPDIVADETIHRMKEAHYVDDRRMAESYIRYHAKDRSLLRIRMDLQKRGIREDLIRELIEEAEETMGEEIRGLEQEQIRAYMRRKHYDPEAADLAARQKMTAFLLRKGYTQEAVRRAFRG